MIIPEDIMREIVEQIPAIQVNATLTKKPNYHWGDRHELTKYLTVQKDSAYPLIWFLAGLDEHTDNGNYVERECVIIIATRESNRALLNDERLKKSYEVVLNPLLDYVVHGLRSYSRTDILREEWKVERKPDYSESYYKGDNDNYTIDKWDAIRLTIDVRFNMLNCKTVISW